jgi:hypothetical protein
VCATFRPPGRRDSFFWSWKNHDLTRDVPVDKLPPVALDHAIKIGLHNLLMDSQAGVKDLAKAEEKVDNKLAALMRGEVRVAMAIRPVNPQEKIALMKAITEIWETRLEHLSTFKSAKRDAEARRLAYELLAQRAQEPAVRKGRKAA